MSQENLISFDETSFVYDPFPMGVTRPTFAPDVYDRLIETWPETEKFVHKPSLGNKFSLSPHNNGDEYREHLRKNELWAQLNEEVTSKEFIDRVLDMLETHYIDLGVRQNADRGRIQRARDWIGLVRRGKTPPRRPKLGARFEFSMMSPDGGHIKPHTDAPQKLITLVMSMMRPGEWNHEHGGGTDMLRPKDIRRNYNHMNEYMEFDDVEVIETFSLDPNQCVIFVKTFNSLHSVAPMRGSDSDPMRRTLTVNIERVN